MSAVFALLDFVKAMATIGEPSINDGPSYTTYPVTFFICLPSVSDTAKLLHGLNYIDFGLALSTVGLFDSLQCNEVATLIHSCNVIACCPFQSFASGESVMTFFEALTDCHETEGFLQLQSNFSLHHVQSNGE
jgi:hypothetical protein